MNIAQRLRPLSHHGWLTIADWERCYLCPTVHDRLVELSLALEDSFPVRVTSSFRSLTSFPVRVCTTGCPLMFVALIISWLNSWESGKRFVFSDPELLGCWTAPLVDCLAADIAAGLLNWWIADWVELGGICWWREAFDDSVAVLTLSALIPANKFSNSATKFSNYKWGCY